MTKPAVFIVVLSMSLSMSLVSSLAAYGHKLIRKETPHDISLQKVENKLTDIDPGSYFEGDVVCHLCKAIAMIVHRDIVMNDTGSIYQDVSNFCDKLPQWIRGLCSIESDVVIPIAKIWSNPVAVCTNPKVGACSSSQKELTKGLLEILKHEAKSSSFILHGEEIKPNNSGCACVNSNCGCCAHLEVAKIHLNDTVCANFSYLPAPEYGISFTVTIDNKTLINKTVSVKNPPPVCVGVPYLKKAASVCLQFRNLTVNNGSLSGCVDFEARLLGEIVEKIQLGCFKIPPGEKKKVAATAGAWRPNLKRKGNLYFEPIKPQNKRYRIDKDAEKLPKE